MFKRTLEFSCWLLATTCALLLVTSIAYPQVFSKECLAQCKRYEECQNIQAYGNQVGGTSTRSCKGYWDDPLGVTQSASCMWCNPNIQMFCTAIDADYTCTLFESQSVYWSWCQDGGCILLCYNCPAWHDQQANCTYPSPTWITKQKLDFCNLKNPASVTE